MKNIGSVLKEKRTEMGISIEEAGEDLKIDSVLLDNLDQLDLQVLDIFYYLSFFYPLIYPCSFFHSIIKTVGENNFDGKIY